MRQRQRLGYGLRGRLNAARFGRTYEQPGAARPELAPRALERSASRAPRSGTCAAPRRGAESVLPLRPSPAPASRSTSICIAGLWPITITDPISSGTCRSRSSSSLAARLRTARLDQHLAAGRDALERLARAPRGGAQDLDRAGLRCRARARRAASPRAGRAVRAAARDRRAPGLPARLRVAQDETAACAVRSCRVRLLRALRRDCAIAPQLDAACVHTTSASSLASPRPGRDSSAGRAHD